MRTENMGQVQQRDIQQPVDGGQYEPLQTSGKQIMKAFTHYSYFIFQEPELSPGLFWLLEQIPGYFRREDLTPVLQSKTFWPSYNSPYFTGMRYIDIGKFISIVKLFRCVQQEWQC